jgi:predicted component of type VI protein secretion system
MRTHVDAMHKRHVLAGQLSRFALNNSNPQAFAADAGLCMARLAAKGYSCKALQRAFRAFTKRHIHVYSHTRCDVYPRARSALRVALARLRAQAAAVAAQIRRAGRTMGI